MSTSLRPTAAACGEGGGGLAQVTVARWEEYQGRSWALKQEPGPERDLRPAGLPLQPPDGEQPSMEGLCLQPLQRTRTRVPSPVPRAPQRQAVCRVGTLHPIPGPHSDHDRDWKFKVLNLRAGFTVGCSSRVCFSVGLLAEYGRRRHPCASLGNDGGKRHKLD